MRIHYTTFVILQHGVIHRGVRQDVTKNSPIAVGEVFAISDFLSPLFPEEL